MYNVRNIRISDGCVYAQICKGLGMHLVTYTNRDMVPFLLLVQYKGGLSEIEFIVSLFSNTCMISLLFLKILCTSIYIKGGILPILVRAHYKDTVTRYDIETLFIIIERCVKLYIFYRVEIVHVRAMAICVIALNRDVSGRSHFIEIKSHSFSILSCVLNRPAFRVRVLLGVINNDPFFGEKSDCYALAY